MLAGNSRRIISLLPGATEWVYALGLGDRLVGVSHECDYPAAVNSLPRVTTSKIDPGQSSGDIDAEVRRHSESRMPLYDLDAEAVAELSPDLILTQSLCNVCAVSERDVMQALTSRQGECELLDLRAHTFDEVLSDAERIAEATGRCDFSVTAIEQLKARVERVRQRSERRPGQRPVVTLLEWTDPLFCAGHWTPQLIQWAGGEDPIGASGQPSRVITPEQLVASDPEILLVACCGMDQARTASELATLESLDGWSDLRCVRAGNVHALDGSSYFNRPGPRLVDALELVANLVAKL